MTGQFSRTWGFEAKDLTFEAKAKDLKYVLEAKDVLEDPPLQDTVVEYVARWP